MRTSRFQSLSFSTIRTSLRRTSSQSKNSTLSSNRDSYSSNASSPINTINAIMHRQSSMQEMDEERRSFASGLEILEPRPIVYWGGMEERMSSFWGRQPSQMHTVVDFGTAFGSRFAYRLPGTVVATGWTVAYVFMKFMAEFRGFKWRKGTIRFDVGFLGICFTSRGLHYRVRSDVTMSKNIKYMMLTPEHFMYLFRFCTAGVWGTSTQYTLWQEAQ